MTNEDTKQRTEWKNVFKIPFSETTKQFENKLDDLTFLLVFVVVDLI
jgi:hypothetical protein